jgi:hypothetical protein
MVGNTLEFGQLYQNVTHLKGISDILPLGSTLLLKKIITAKLLKKFLYLSCNHNIHYRIPNSLPLDTIQIQMKLVYNFSHYHY